MKHLAILATIAVLAMPMTAYADEAWDAECSGNLSAFLSGQKTETVSAEDFKFQGVVEHGGHEETWYSSNVLRHYRTDEWTPDEDGFYRTDDGYFVVASDAYEQGAVIQTSRGLAQVLDSGCGDAVDFYTQW